MELTELKYKICTSFTGSKSELVQILHEVESKQSVYPFNEYEFLICHLLENRGLTFQQYLVLRQEYIDANPNLYLFEISAPRSFGEKFAQTYVQAKSDNLRRPSKQLDDNYSGQYDLILDNIKIEVKASRAVDASSDEPLYMRALSRQTDKPFLMNFQQLKPQCCDIFIWVAVFRDEIVLWVIPSQDIEQHSLFSKGQHRGNHGNEGQLHMTHENIHLFEKYELKNQNLATFIRNSVQTD